MTLEKHFVTFYSPGTFVTEDTTREIASWDVERAMEMAHSIVERYGARPYGFMFSTRARGDEDLDSKVVRTSGMYYLGGKILTYDEVKGMGKDYEILADNMRINKWDRVIETSNSYRWTSTFDKNDVLLEWTPRPIPEEAGV